MLKPIHINIITGLEENKFGVNRWELEEVLHTLKNLKNLNLFVFIFT